MPDAHSNSGKAIRDLDGEAVGASRPAICETDLHNSFQRLRRDLAEYKKTTGRRYSGLIDGVAVSFFPELLITCEVLSDRFALIDKLPKNGAFAEVGTLMGDFIARVIDINQPQSIDLFDLSFSMVRPEHLDKLIKHGEVAFHEGASSFELSKFQDSTFDIVYVDADHSFEGVMKDLPQALRVLKPGGYIVCNDFTCWDPIQCIPYGVYAAVTIFANKNRLPVIYIGLQSDGFHDICLQKPI